MSDISTLPQGVPRQSHPVPCPGCGCLIFIRENKTIVSHYNRLSEYCHLNETLADDSLYHAQFPNAGSNALKPQGVLRDEELDRELNQFWDELGNGKERWPKLLDYVKQVRDRTQAAMDEEYAGYRGWALDQFLRHQEEHRKLQKYYIALDTRRAELEAELKSVRAKTLREAIEILMNNEDFDDCLGKLDRAAEEAEKETTKNEHGPVCSQPTR